MPPRTTLPGAPLVSPSVASAVRLRKSSARWELTDTPVFAGADGVQLIGPSSARPLPGRRTQSTVRRPSDGQPAQGHVYALGAGLHKPQRSGSPSRAANFLPGCTVKGGGAARLCSCSAGGARPRDPARGAEDTDPAGQRVEPAAAPAQMSGRDGEGSEPCECSPEPNRGAGDAALRCTCSERRRSLVARREPEDRHGFMGLLWFAGRVFVRLV